MARHEHGSISSFAEHCWVRRRSSLLPSRRSSHAHGATNLSWKYFRLLRYATPQRYVASLSLDHAPHAHSPGKRLITSVRMAFEYLSNVQVLCAGSAPGSRPARVFKDLYQHGVGTLQASCSQADEPLCPPSLPWLFRSHRCLPPALCSCDARQLAIHNRTWHVLHAAARCRT